MKNFDEIVAAARARGPKRLAVAGPPDSELAKALAQAREEGLAEASIHDTAADAVRSVRAGEADILFKGTVDTRSFMGAVLDREKGLRSGRLISHVAVVEGRGRLFLVTDGGICLDPTLEEKADIIRNAVTIALRLGIDTPRVAVLSATEKENPKMPDTADAVKLAAMDIPGCIVQGPLAVDTAVCPEAAAVKGLAGPVAGRADILLVPSVLVGNIFCKGIMYFSDCPFGGIVAGTSRPVAFLSRSDTAMSRLNTIALGVVTADG